MYFIGNDLASGHHLRVFGPRDLSMTNKRYDFILNMNFVSSLWPVSVTVNRINGNWIDWKSYPRLVITRRNISSHIGYDLQFC